MLHLLRVAAVGDRDDERRGSSSCRHGVRCPSSRASPRPGDHLRVETMFVPCRPRHGCRPSAVPRRRVEEERHRMLADEQVAVRDERRVGHAGRRSPLRAGARRAPAPGRDPSQTTSLAGSRSACSARSAASPRRLRRSGSRRTWSARPWTPLDPQLQRLDEPVVDVAQRARADRECCAFVTFCRSCCGEPVELRRELGRFAPGVINAFATPVPSACELRAIVATLSR